MELRMPVRCGKQLVGLKVLLLVGLFVVHALPFANRPALIGGDETQYALMAHSIAVDRDLDPRNNHEAVQKEASPAAGKSWAGQSLDLHLRSYRDEMIFSHPVGLPFLAAPFIWALQLVAPGAAPDWVLGLLGLGITYLALLAGWDLLAGLLRNSRDATILTFGLYFTTPLWFYSRTFYTEPYIWSFTVLAIWSMSRNRWILGCLLLGLTFLMKETALLIIVPILVYVWKTQGTGRAAQVMGFTATFILAFCLKNRIAYGQFLVTFQPYQIGNFLKGLAGVLFDLRHGLIPFAPFLIVAVVGWRRGWPESRRWHDPGFYAFLIFVSYYLVTAFWVDWGGGSCYGPRLILPAIPTLALPIARAWEHFGTRSGFRFLLYGLMIGGFSVQVCAATHPFEAFWSESIPELLTRNFPYAITGMLLGAGILIILTRTVPHTPREVRIT